MLPVNFLCSLSMLIIVGDHNTGAAATRTKTQQCATVTFQLCGCTAWLTVVACTAWLCNGGRLRMSVFCLLLLPEFVPAQWFKSMVRFWNKVAALLSD